LPGIALDLPIEEPDLLIDGLDLPGVALDGLGAGRDVADDFAGA
jgi:hypothetical protein